MTSKIKDFFKDQTLFITGGTGFVGKVLIEKLLRECEDIRKIYLLIRSKKGRTPSQRFEAIFTLPCFERLNKQSLEKVSLIMGDLYQDLLGISNQDFEVLLKETTCVIHAAADVKFTQSLKEACDQIKATENIFRMAENMPNLKSFVYVSTAYSNCINPVIEEKIYKPVIKPQSLINIVDNFEADVLEQITPLLLNKWPNSYVFMKNITESMVEKVGQKIPISIVRPAIISSSAEDPIPGWTDNIYSLNAIVVTGCLGILRSFLIDVEKTGQIVPVDYVSNCILTVVWKTSEDSTTKIYNYVRHQEKLPTWGKFLEIATYTATKIGSTKQVWHPSYGFMTKNKIWHKIRIFFWHIFVANIVDFVLFCLGKPTIAVKGYKRLDAALDKISYFSLREWKFHDDNVTKLWCELNEEDKKNFKFKNEDFEWETYFEKMCWGLRTFFLKESPDTGPEGRRKFHILRVAHYTLTAIFWYIIYKCIYALVSFFYA